MKWLIVSALLIPAMAFSKSYDVSLDNAPTLSESMLEQQRGGFYLPGINYSIGLRMEALVNGDRVFFSDVFNIANNRLVLPAINGLPEGLKITPLNGNGKVGYVLENSANGLRTDVRLEIDIVTPKALDAVKIQQDISTRLRSAGY
ncbi:hypothetical protein [Zobellella maritima]|uniref:hypothetical protein n=1 Tax=Zobellella maritima TaxID=2059725 RepID=UPI000E305202|nr:hypothetical protein [Zobellella maritima]